MSLPPLKEKERERERETERKSLPFPSPSILLSRSPLDKLLEVGDRSHAENKPPARIRDDGEVLRPPLALALGAAEKGLELLEGRLHGDDGVLAPLALEPRHGGAQGVGGVGGARVEEGLQAGDGGVAEEGAGVGVDDGEVGVVALEGGEEGEGDGVRGVEGEGGRGVEVLHRCLFLFILA